MNILQKVIALAVLLLAAPAALPAAEPAKAPAKPNIIIILADDMGQSRTLRITWLPVAQGVTP